MDRRLFHVLDAFEVPLYVLGGARVAIVEGDALVEAKDVHAVSDDLPFLSEVRDEFHLLAVIGDLQDAAIDVIVDGRGSNAGRIVRIEGIDIGEAADLDRAAAPGLLRIGQGHGPEWHGLECGEAGSGPGEGLECGTPTDGDTQLLVDDGKSIAALTHTISPPQVWR